MLPLLASIGLGLKGILDSEKQKKEKQAQAMADAKAIQFSPWSGLNVSNLVGKDYSSQGTLSGLVQGAATGYQTGAGIENAMADTDYRKNLSNYYKNKDGDGYKSISDFIPDKMAGMEPSRSSYQRLYNSINPNGPEDYSDHVPENLLKGYAVRKYPVGNA
jgi:hypothetical protein